MDTAGGRCSRGGTKLGDAEMRGLSTPGGDGTRKGGDSTCPVVLGGVGASPVPPWGFPHPSLLQAQELDLVLVGPTQDIQGFRDSLILRLTPSSSIKPLTIPKSCSSPGPDLLSLPYMDTEDIPGRQRGAGAIQNPDSESSTNHIPPATHSSHLICMC